MKIFTIVFLILYAQYTSAAAELIPVNNFTELKTIATQLGKHALNETLIVMDDDDTLTMMPCPDANSAKTCQYIGGPAWYAWQSDLLQNAPHSPFLVASSSEELLKISALLLSLNNMKFTQSEIPTVLKDLVGKGVRLLVLTARGPANLSATQNQFSQLSMGKVKTKGESLNFKQFIGVYAPIGRKSGVSSFAGDFMPKNCAMERSTLYQDGVFFVAGQNKGEMLSCFLKHTQLDGIKNILFIDDTLQNAEDVFATFENSKTLTVKALHYTFLQNHKLRLTLLKPGGEVNPYQLEAHKRWSHIKSALQSELLEPAAIQH